MGSSSCSWGRKVISNKKFRKLCQSEIYAVFLKKEEFFNNLRLSNLIKPFAFLTIGKKSYFKWRKPPGDVTIAHKLFLNLKQAVLRALVLHSVEFQKPAIAPSSKMVGFKHLTQMDEKEYVTRRV